MAKNVEEFLFANGYICSHIKNLLSRNDLVRIASAKDMKIAKSILREHGYDDDVDLIDKGIEYFIRREQNKLYELVFHTLSDRKSLGLFLFEFDYHNIKVFMKAEFLNIKADDTYVVSTSYIDHDKLELMIKERNFMNMTSNMKEAIREALDIFARSHDPQQVDIILDRACYSDMLKGANRLESQFLVDFVKLKIDITNLKTFVRLKNIKKPWSFFKTVYIEGGNISEKFFISMYEEPLSQVAEKLIPFGFGNVLGESSEKITSKGDFMLFEKLCDDKKMDFSKNAKYQTSGIEPIAGYWLAKETELMNIRIALSGIVSKIEPDVIVERLRESYV